MGKILWNKTTVFNFFGFFKENLEMLNPQFIYMYILINKSSFFRFTFVVLKCKIIIVKRIEINTEIEIFQTYKNIDVSKWCLLTF